MEVFSVATIRTSDGISLYAKQSGTGPAILFVHGNNFDSACWDYFMASLPERGFRCAAYDRRGFGRSDSANALYSYDSLADDLASVISELDLSEVTLVGHSVGCGEIARYMSRSGGERVAGAILIGTATPSVLQTPENPTGIPAEALQAVADGTLEDRPGYFSSLVDEFVRPGVSEQMKAYLLDLTYRTPLASAVDCAKLSLRPGSDFTHDLRTMAKPTLIIHGDEDSFFPLQLTALPTAELVRGSELEVYENAGHGLIFSMQERVRNDIASFVTRNIRRNAA
jgi:non-heme chloroperoxidase